MKALLLLLMLPLVLQAQVSRPVAFPQQEIDNVLQKASGTAKPPTVTNTTSSEFHYGAYQNIELYRSCILTMPKLSKQSGQWRGSDTLVVGSTPKDTLVVTGTWENNGPIFVENDGVLIIKDAYATILGNIYVFGSGQLIADSSTLYIPQQYFYQRSVIAADYASITVRNCTFNFGGLNHNFVLANSSVISLHKVHFTDWTTTGTYGGHPTLSVDSCNTLGEIVITDSSIINVKNTDTVLLWHQVPRKAQLTWTFPNGINLTHYSFTPASPGVGGMNYNIEVDTCSLVWWALMPTDSSNIVITNSKIRAIGAWFTGKDSAVVTGLLDNASYTSSGNLFTDRTLLLNNTSVTTWSLYPMDTSVVEIMNCEAGEIGSETNAHTVCSSVFVDGSGGYFWVNGSAAQYGVLCAFTCNVRSEENGIELVGYSSIANGTASGIDESILFLVQTPTLQQPVAYDGSDVWVAQLSSPATASVNDSVTLPGSAYILRGPSSQLMSFDHYYLKYQPAGGSQWFPVTGDITSPVNQNTLGKWSTYGLSPGNYNLLLTLADNYGDTVIVNTTVNLLPAILTGVQTLRDDNISIFPNPASDEFTINIPSGKYNVLTITDVTGKVLEERNIFNYSGNEVINASNFSNGVYFVRVIGASGNIVKKLVVQK